MADALIAGFIGAYFALKILHIYLQEMDYYDARRQAGKGTRIGSHKKGD